MEEAYNGCCKPLDIERWVTRFHRKVREKETIYVDVPQGIGDNENIIVKEKGNMYSKNSIGDIKVMISIDTSNCIMEREGLNLIYKHTITLKEALCGFSFDLEHINGKKFRINNGDGSVVGVNYQKVCTGLGMKRGEHRGNLIIIFNIKFPIKISLKQVEQLKNIL